MSSPERSGSQAVISIDTDSAASPVVSSPSVGHTGGGASSSTAAGSPGVTKTTFVDQFGFELPTEEAVEEELRYVRTIDGVRVERREIKWSNMAREWEAMMKKKFEKVKERSRKGIPHEVRGLIWQLLTSSRSQMDSPANSGVFRALTAKRLPAEVDSLIERDLGRTFPTHTLFRDVDGEGQNHLRNILRAYAAIDPEVGYVQGMGFIVGTLLTRMNEEEAFWCLHQLMNHNTYRMRELFRPGFPMLQMFFYQLRKLLEKCIPKVAAHLEQVGCDMSFFASQWFLTLFVYHFSFRAVLRVWDIFFCEGWKIIFRVAICLLKWEEKSILSQQLDQLLPRMRALHEGKNPDEIIERALKIKFTTEDLRVLRERYETALREGLQPD